MLSIICAHVFFKASLIKHDNQITEFSQAIPFQFVSENTLSDQNGNPMGRVRIYQINILMDGAYRALRMTITESIERFKQPVTGAKIQEWKFSDRRVRIAVLDPVHGTVLEPGENLQSNNPVGDSTEGRQRPNRKLLLEDGR